MGILLVDLSPAERAALQDLPDAQPAAATELEDTLTPDVTVVVIGSMAAEPVAVAQQVHRHSHDTGIAVLTAPDTEADVRRQVVYAPGVPLDLLVLAPGDDLPARIAALSIATHERRQHQSLVAAVSSQMPVPAAPPQPDLDALREAERQRDQLVGHVELLARVSESLMTTLDAGESLTRLARLLTPVLADWVSVQLIDEGGGLRTVAMQHRDPALATVVERAQQRQAATAAVHALGRRAAEGEPVLVTGLTEADFSRYIDDPVLRQLFSQLGAASALAVPLRGRGRVLGSLVLVNAPGSRELAQSELTVATEVGRRAGTALDNARLYAQQRDLALELQRSLLTEPPQPDHCQIVVRYVAAAAEAQVGGDWYDAFLQPDGSTVLVIGDVVGHDTRAAAAMGQLRGLLRGIGFTTGANPAEVLARVDHAIEGLMSATTATAVVARLEQTSDERDAGLDLMRWSNAGHPPPIVIRPDGRVEVLHGSRNEEADLLLGIDRTTSRHDWQVDLQWETVVLLYTDGLVERRGQSLDEGLEELVTVLADCGDCSLDELCDTVLERMLPLEPDDDVALVAVRLHRQDEPRPPDAGPNVTPSKAPPTDQS